MLPLSHCLFPLTKPDKGLSFFPSLLAISVFVLYQTRLPFSLYSLLLFAKKVSGGPRAPGLVQGACLSSVREVVVGGWVGRVCVVSEGEREGRKKEQKRVYYFI